MARAATSESIGREGVNEVEELIGRTGSDSEEASIGCTASVATLGRN